MFWKRRQDPNAGLNWGMWRQDVKDQDVWDEDARCTCEPPTKAGRWTCLRHMTGVVEVNRWDAQP